MTDLEATFFNLRSNVEPTVNDVHKGPVQLITEDLVTDRSAKLLIGLKGKILFTPQAVAKLLVIHRKELSK